MRSNLASNVCATIGGGTQTCSHSLSLSRRRHHHISAKRVFFLGGVKSNGIGRGAAVHIDTLFPISLCVLSERSPALLYCICCVAPNCKTQVLSIASKILDRCAVSRASPLWTGIVSQACAFNCGPSQMLDAQQSGVDHTAMCCSVGHRAVSDNPLVSLANRESHRAAAGAMHALPWRSRGVKLYTTFPGLGRREGQGRAGDPELPVGK